jgi:fatty-acyl-CoA synthase
MKDFEERHGVRIFQAWGMTETSPVATYARPREDEHDDAYWDERARQGRPLPWVELRLIGDDGREVAWDGSATGEIEVRGPWVAASYFRDDADEDKFDAGWLRTGDIASVDEKASVQITDRAKDVIKSGGEWISSVELENQLMAHPDVVEAAVIANLRDRVAKWWLPDEFAFVAEIPKTSVGKFDKKVLRGRLAEDRLEGRTSVGDRQRETAG